MTCIRATNVPALKWGLKCEAIARKSYKCLLESQMLQTGLYVCRSEPFLCASANGIVSCSCHGKRILEIKCPWSARDLDPLEAIETGVITYIGTANNAYTLKPGDSRGYFEQVQGTMAIVGVPKCDFVLWTTRGMLTFEVTYIITCFGEFCCQTSADLIFSQLCCHGDPHRTCLACTSSL